MKTNKDQFGDRMKMFALKGIKKETKKIIMKLNEILSSSEELTRVYSTNNYDLFGFIDGNRNVNNSNLKKIKESMSKKHFISKTMKFDNELIKDFIIEKDPTVKRKNIIFENVYISGELIMAPYRELIWSNKFSVKLEDYELRLKEKSRDNKLNELGI